VIRYYWYAVFTYRDQSGQLQKASEAFFSLTDEFPIASVARDLTERYNATTVVESWAPITEAQADDFCAWVSMRKAEKEGKLAEVIPINRGREPECDHRYLQVRLNPKTYETSAFCTVCNKILSPSPNGAGA
jgi:hypothetical protein